MNKSEFIKELSKQTKYDEEKCTLINSIIEKMIERFKVQLGIDENDANNLYEIAMSIIGGAIKDKLKHPFKSQD